MVNSNFKIIVSIVVITFIFVLEFNRDIMILLSGLLFIFSITISLLQAKKRTGIFSWSFGIPMFYFFFFLIFLIIEQFLEINNYIGLNRIPIALFYSSIGIFSFSLGNLIFFNLFYKKKENIHLVEKLPFKSFNNFYFNIFVLILGLLAKYFAFSIGSYYGLVRANNTNIDSISVFYNFFALFISLVNINSWWRYFASKRNEKKWFYLGIISTFSLVGSALLSNSKAEILSPLVSIFLAYVLIYNKLNWKYIFLLALLFIFIVFPFITNLRKYFWSHSYSTNQEYFSLAFKYLLSGDWFNKLGDIQSSINSLGRGLLNVFSIIIDETGRQTKFLMGETYLKGFESLIPRVLWPYKPDQNLGNLVGYKYSLISTTDYITNISPSQMGEMYMNFGLFGIAIGMLTWGLFAGFVDTTFIGIKNKSWISVWILMLISYQESLFGHTIIVLLKYLIFLFLSLFFFTNIQKIILLKNKKNSNY